jgi:hypothetical protein
MSTGDEVITIVLPVRTIERVLYALAALATIAMAIYTLFR